MIERQSQIRFPLYSDVRIYRAHQASSNHLAYTWLLKAIPSSEPPGRCFRASQDTSYSSAFLQEFASLLPFQLLPELFKWWLNWHRDEDESNIKISAVQLCIVSDGDQGRFVSICLQGCRHQSAAALWQLILLFWYPLTWVYATP